MGDGVEDDTRQRPRALPRRSESPLLRSAERGAARRAAAPRGASESTAPIVRYLCDDDLLLPGHVPQWPSCSSMPTSQRTPGQRLARWEHPLLRVRPRAPRIRATPRRRPRRWRPHGRRAHTRGSTTVFPSAGVPRRRRRRRTSTCGSSSSRARASRASPRTGSRRSSFQSSSEATMTDDERVAELERWERRIRTNSSRRSSRQLTFAAARRASRTAQADLVRLEAELERVRRTRWWRARRAVAELRPRTNAERQTARSSLREPSAASRGRSAGPDTARLQSPGPGRADDLGARPGSRLAQRAQRRVARSARTGLSPATARRSSPPARSADVLELVLEP